MRLTETQRLFRDSLREYLESEVEPVVADRGDEPLSKDEALGYLRDLRELGIGYDPATAEEYFGELRFYALGSEEISRVWPSLNAGRRVSNYRWPPCPG